MAHASPEEGNRSPKRIKTCDVLATIRRAFSEMELPSEPEQPSLVVETVFTEMERSERVKELAPLKLLKLIFFAHGIAAAVFNKRLIREEFEGWPFGPVARSVYDDLGYKGNVPLPFLGEASKIKPSQMMELCIALAVAAHGRDSTYIIKFKSHIPLWHEYHGDVWDHVVMPFNGIKEWFSQDDIIVQEVLAGMLPRVKPDVRNSIFTLLARNPSLRSGFSDQAISAEAARKLNKHVVIWPGQSAINAMIVASTKSTSLYDSVCTQLDEGSQEYLAVLARLAGLGDWVALARLGDHVDLESDLEHRRSRFKGTVSDAQSDEERYAFGAFLFLVDEDAKDAISVWEKCKLDHAKVAMAACGDDPAVQLSALGDIGEPYASFARDDLDSGIAKAASRRCKLSGEVPFRNARGAHRNPRRRTYRFDVSRRAWF
jgi:hypothetical protein